MLTFVFGSIEAQDPVFSQFYNSPLHLNPALTGNTFGPKVAINYRNQWPSLSFAYVTYAASYDQFFKKYNSGIGFSVLADDAGQGIYKTNKLAFDYAYSIQLKKDHYIKIGIEPAISQSRLNWDKLVFADQINGESGVITPGGSNLPGTEQRPEVTNKVFFDVGVGGVYYNPIWYLGASVKHLTAPDIRFIETGKAESIRGVPLRLSFHSGAQFPVRAMNIRKNKAYFAPQVMYMHQGPFDQILVGGNMDIGVISFGGWLRHTFRNADALVATFGYEQDFFRIEYSFDFTISGLGNQGGAHEVGIVLTFEDQNRQVDYNDCFQIFR